MSSIVQWSYTWLCCKYQDDKLDNKKYIGFRDREQINRKELYEVGPVIKAVLDHLKVPEGNRPIATKIIEQELHSKKCKKAMENLPLKGRRDVLIAWLVQAIRQSAGTQNGRRLA
jgi:hypothetical protein